MESASSSVAAGPTTGFRPEQFEDPYPDEIDRHYWTLARNRIIARCLANCLDASTTFTVLDIGCGRGVTVDHLRRCGYEALGCDLTQAHPIRERITPFLHFNIDALQWQACVDDVGAILLLDVLEHLPQPAEFLAACAEHYHRCNYFLVTVPARQELWTNYDEHYGHVRRYDLERLRELGRQTHFTVTKIGYFFHALYLPARAMVLCGIPRSTRLRAPGRATPWLHRWIAGAFLLEESLIPRAWWGTSALALFTRADRQREARGR